LNEREKIACKSLLKKNCNKIETREAEAIEVDLETPEASPGLAARATRFIVEKKTETQKTNPYVNCDFIYGSTAEVERLWSVSANVLSKKRRRMTPQLVEAILFLRSNRRFWNLQLVAKAMEKDRLEKAEQRILEEEELDATLSNDDESGEEVE
jgi:hypothetical protein